MNSSSNPSPAGTSTARYGVIGHPIGHSRSPWIHTQFAQQCGHALRYDAVDSPPDAFANTLQQLRQQGYRGVNVTVPFKAQAHALAQQRSPRAELAQAANCLKWTAEGTLYADNTDGPGLVTDITRNAGTPIAGRHLLLLGAGGAAAGVLGALIQAQPASITIANRTTERALALLHRHQPLASQHACALHIALLADVLGHTGPLGAAPGCFDLIINATSTSLDGTALALPARRAADHALVLDMMYGPAAQAFLQPLAAHASRGIQLRDGLGMLVEQAALSFALWRGVQPDTATVLRELRHLLDRGQ